MRMDTNHAETQALRTYVETVAEAVGVEPTATWHDYGPPSSAYVALADRSPDHPDRFLMLQWHSETGWALAVEPDGAEPPIVLARWPESVYPDPVDLSSDVREALTKQVTLPVHVPSPAPARGDSM